MLCLQHELQRLLEGPRRVGQETRASGQRLVFVRIKDMQDYTDQQRMPCLFPMIAAFQRAFRINQNVGDVLHIADLARALAHFHQRIEARRTGIGRIKAQAGSEA